MSGTQIVFMIVAILAVIIFLAARAGPRVTRIDRTTKKDKDSDDA